MSAHFSSAARGDASASRGAQPSASSSSHRARSSPSGASGGAHAARGDEAADTLDKLLTELCNAAGAGAGDAARAAAPGARRRGGLGAGLIPDSAWDAAGWSRAGAGPSSGADARSASPGASSAHSDDDDDDAATDLDFRRRAGAGAGRRRAHAPRAWSARARAHRDLFRASGVSHLDDAYDGHWGGVDAVGGIYAHRSGLSVRGDAAHHAASSDRSRRARGGGDAAGSRRGLGGYSGASSAPWSATRRGGWGFSFTSRDVGASSASGSHSAGSSRRHAGGDVGQSLREHVEAEARDKTQEQFARYMRDLYGRIVRLVNAGDVRKRLGGVYAIDQLTDAKLGETVGKLNRFASYLRDVFTPTCEPRLAEAASRALGHLVQVGGALTADIVELEVRRALSWLDAAERVEARRYAAVLILRELARNAPTVFNVHVPAFIDAIWPALRDPNVAVREAAVEALRECLVVVEQRETRYRVQWYYKLYEETRRGLTLSRSRGGADDREGGAQKSPSGKSGSLLSGGKSGRKGASTSSPGDVASAVSSSQSHSGSQSYSSVEYAHGSLLAFGEMLRHTGEFMLSRYKEVAETILSLHESRDRVVRRAVVELVPRLAAFSPRRFCESYLARSAAILLASIRGPPSERDAGFDAVGDLALALAEDDDDSDDDETETLRSHDAAPSRESSRGGGGGQSGQSGFGFAASAASSVSRRSSDGGNLSLADSAASGHAGQGSSQGAQGHHQGSQGSQQGQQNARPRRSGSLAEKTWSGPSQTNLNLARAVAADRRAANHRRLGVAALERYLPEIASAIRETCVASAKASQGSGGGSYYGGGAYGGGVPGFNLNLGGGGARGGDGKNRTAAGRSGGSSFLEPGAAEALLCVGALASSCGELWEPHARALLPALFAPGLTAPLVDALDAVAVALPATLPMIQRRLIETISGILAPIHHARAGGGGQGGIGPGTGATRRGGFYSYASGGGGGAFGPSSPSRGGGGVLGAGGLGAASTRVSNGDHHHGVPPKSPTRSTIEDSVRAGGAMLQRVVSGIFDPSGSGGGAAGSSASGSFRDHAPSGAASGDSSRGAKIPLPHRVQRVSSADDLPDAAGAFGSFGTPPGTPLRGRDFYGAQGDSAGNPSNASALGAGSPGRAAGYGPGAHPGGGYPPGPAGAFHGADAYGSARGGVSGESGFSSNRSTHFSRQGSGSSAGSGSSGGPPLDAHARRARRRRVRLALRTLGTFPFEPSTLLGFVRGHVVEYLGDDDPATRREAALTCCRLLEVRSREGEPRDAAARARASTSLKSGGAAAAGGFEFEGGGRGTGPGGPGPKSAALLPGFGASWSAATEAFIVSRLLASAVSDLDAGVRRAVLASFCLPSGVADGHLGQAEALRALFLTLNDESSDVRLLAIRLVGRLAPRNPAYALPALRRHLLQLLNELEHSAESHVREESARLSAALVRSCTRLALPYIAPILRTLMAKLRRPEEAAGPPGSNIGGGGIQSRTGSNGIAKGGSSAGAGGGIAGAGAGADAGAANRGTHAAEQNAGNAGGGFGFGGDAMSGAVAGGPSGGGHPGALAAAAEGDQRGGATLNGGANTGGANASGSSGLYAATGRSTKRGAAHIVSVREKAAALATIGELARVGGAGIARAFGISELLRLIIDGIKAGSTRDVAVMTLGQLAESTGYVVQPYRDHPRLLSLMLKVLAEESGPVRAEVLRTLGVLGALDPHAHRDNEVRLHGQGLLSMEGVRGVLARVAKSNRGDLDERGGGKDGLVDGEKGGIGPGGPGGGPLAGGGGGRSRGGLHPGGGEDDDDDLLPSRNLTTASENFYPTVALNALLRVLRDDSMASHHHMVVRSVMYIFRSLGLSCVQYLPATMPVILKVARECDDVLREFTLAQLTALVAIIRGHVRTYLDDILDVIRAFWAPGPLLRQMLRLCEELATALHDDFRQHLPDLLPRMIAVLADAERSGDFASVPGVLHALEAFGSAVDEHLHLMLPALVRLFRPGVAPVPWRVRSLVIRSLATLLPRMQLAGHASAVAHPLVRVLDGPQRELRRDALTALTSLAHALGRDFLLFLPLVRRAMEKREMRDPVFERLVALLEAGGGGSLGLGGPGGFIGEGAFAYGHGFSGFAGFSGSADALVDPTSHPGGSSSSQHQGHQGHHHHHPPGAGAGAGAGGYSSRGASPGPPSSPGPHSGGESRSRGGSQRGGSVRGGGGEGTALPPPAKQLAVDEVALRRAWESSQRSTKDDWLEWMRHLSVELLKQSPSPALRACIDLAQVQPHLARDLFCASFVSCWAELGRVSREQLVRSLEAAFGSPTIPPEIVTTLLNLAEFCEHDEKPLPVDVRTLGAIAERCRAYAKALHYKETEFVSNPSACVEAIIAINNQLQLPEAAMGVLVYTQAHLRLEIKEGWYEKLGQWDNALEAYRRKAAQAETRLAEAGAGPDGQPMGASSFRSNEQGGQGGGGNTHIHSNRSGSQAERERSKRRAERRREQKERERGEKSVDGVPIPGGERDGSGSASAGSTPSATASLERHAAGSLGTSVGSRAEDKDVGSSNLSSGRHASAGAAVPPPPPPPGNLSLAEMVMNRASVHSATDARREAVLGQARCLGALAEWEALGALCRTEWALSAGTGSAGAGGVGAGGDATLRARVAPLAARAAWHLGDWDRMEAYVDAMEGPWGPYGGGHGGDGQGGSRGSRGGRGGISAIGVGLPGGRSSLWGDSASGARRGGESAFAGGAASGYPSAAFFGSEAVGVATDLDFYRAVLAVKRGDADEARLRTASARDALGAELAALVTESYDRSYGGMVRAQQLTELEEVIEYAELGQKLKLASPEDHPHAGNQGGGYGGGKTTTFELGGGVGNGGVGGASDARFGAFSATANVGDARSAATRRELMRKMWRERIYGVQRNVEVWQALLAVRSLVLPMHEETETWLKFASLNRKAGRTRQARRTLLTLLEYDPIECAPGTGGYGAGSGRPDVMLAYVKHQWALGNRRDAFSRLQSLVGELRATSAAASLGTGPAPSPKLIARAFLKLGQWRWAIAEDMDDRTVTDVLTAFRTATDACRQWAKAWHHWALFNAAAMEHYAKDPRTRSACLRHVAPAISGFFRSIALGGAAPQKGKGGPLQDILRLLTLWFNHGAAPEVEAALMEGFGHVSIDTWLAVIPQIVARIHSNSLPVRSLIHQLLVRVGRQHPQALLYPLLVACKSQSTSRRSAAMVVLDNLRQHSALLVEQAQVVSLELIRVAILWHEAWHEALEEASQLYFGEQNVDGMLRVLAPLHHIIERLGAETLHEISFVQVYGRELQEANEWCQKYRETGREEELNQAWDLYYHVFKRINKQLPQLTTLELQYVSPRLLNARGLELCVPGNYMPGVPGGAATIAAFARTMHVITSKQRPRRLQIHGSDGKDYGYLLKGHEDLRQDERVMQLFGLVNMLLDATPATSAGDLSIARYAVVPLSPNSGLIGWVPNCDTLHALIREHRDAHKVPLNLEHRLMLAMAPDYDHLPLVNKVEVFEHALENTPGNDLARVLWLKSRSSEVWLDRRTTYTRSLAVMSMVGYLLGLGDRHPSNLMLDRYSGKILHIDFGDCFEASMHREKYPERVPFRLTRMLVRAMEVSGIEGNFRSTCEGVMTVLRQNKDSVMAMLEAFVHDPLINWRLLNTTGPGENANDYAGAGVMAVSAVHAKANAPTPTATPGPDGGPDGDRMGDQAAAAAAGGNPLAVPPAAPNPPGEGAEEAARRALAEEEAAATARMREAQREAAERAEANSAETDSAEAARRGDPDPRFAAGPPGPPPPNENENKNENDGSGSGSGSGSAAPPFAPAATRPRPRGAGAGGVDVEGGSGGGGGGAGAGDERSVAAGTEPDPATGTRSESERASGRGAGLEAVPEDASRTEYAVSAAPAADAAAIASDGHVDVETVYAAASELQRGRVTALDAVEGLAVDANEALNDRAVSVMRRMSHKLTGRDGTPGSAAAAAGAAGDDGGGAGSPGAQARNDELDNAAPDGVEAQVQRLVVAATSHENLCQSYVGWCPFW